MKQHDTPTGGVPTGIIKKKRDFSYVWIVPIVALLIGSGLIYKAFTDKGPVIEIHFKNAEGLEAKKTKVKYKNVDVGVVKSIRLNDSLSNVILKVQFNKNMDDFLTEKTRFWVVRARIDESGVSGLGTILSGAYIGMDPSKNGEKNDIFMGLERPPTVTMDTPGRYYNLKADDMGSLDVNSPVFFRRIKVGHVVNYDLNPDGKSVDLKIFIKSPHHKKIFKTTRFWNASGVDIRVDPSGLQVNTESFITLLEGGISFENLESLSEPVQALEDNTFHLYASRSKVDEPVYSNRNYYVLNFEESIRGLKPGAPVEFRGYKIGEVVDVKLIFSGKELDFQTPVLIAFEPDRIGYKDVKALIKDKNSGEKVINYLVSRGYRAQLRSGILLTGQQYVNMDFFPNAPYDEIKDTKPYKEFPTIASTMSQIPDQVESLMNQLTKIPFEQIGTELLSTIKNANKVVGSEELFQSVQRLERSMVNIETITQKLDQLTASEETLQSVKDLQTSLENLKKLSNELNRQMDNELGDTIKKGHQTLEAAENLLSEDSPMMNDLSTTLQELSRAARSINELVDYLEQHPDSIIFGKGANK